MFSFSAIAFNMMKPLSTLSVRAGTTMIKQSYSARQSPTDAIVYSFEIPATQ